MTHRIITMLIATLLTTSLAAANLTVSGVYYDPAQAESDRSIHSPHESDSLISQYRNL